MTMVVGDCCTTVICEPDFRGFVYVAYPAKYGNTGIKTFLIDQDQVVFEKDLGNDSAAAAKAMTAFNPDNTWTELK
jgi:hypothetical protein